MQNLYEAHMLKDSTYVRIYCHPQVSETNIENLFHAIRLFSFLQHKETDCLQSTQLLFSIREKHGCFPVIPEWENPTHTALWHELFDTPYLNGDLNLLGLRRIISIIYGILVRNFRDFYCRSI